MYIDGPEKHRLNKVYRALPEEFYTQSGLPVITPDNMHDFIKHMKENGHIFIFDLQELCSGSGRLSLTAFHKGMKVAFPVDLRYKWDTNNEEHQALLSGFSGPRTLCLSFGHLSALRGQKVPFVSHRMCFSVNEKMKITHFASSSTRVSMTMSMIWILRLKTHAQVTFGPSQPCMI